MKQVEKEHFAKLLKELALFCEIRVLTHCVLNNHFHLLLAVPKPPPPELRPDGPKLLEKLKGLSIIPCVEGVRQQLDAFKQRNDVEGEAAFLSRYHRRMWDLSVFMKLLKQRFSYWYNRTHDRKGTLWEERFKSLMVEAESQALAAVAVYIDLNAKRANQVDDPKDYRWSGYGAAIGGQSYAQEGIRMVMQLSQQSPVSVTEALERYRLLLYQVGDLQRQALGEGGRPLRGGFSLEEVRRQILQKGRLPLRVLLVVRQK